MAYIGSIAPKNLASNLGEISGAGLGNALTALAEGKLGRLQKAHKEKEFLQAGYPKEAAKLFSMYHDQSQIFKLLQNYQPPVTQQEEMFQPNQDVIPNSNGRSANNLSAQPKLEGQNPSLQKQNVPAKSPNMNQAPMAATTPIKPIAPQQKQNISAAPTFQNNKLLEQQQKQQNKLIDQQQKQQAAIEKANKPYRDSLEKRAVVINEALPYVQKMMDLLDTGNVATGLFSGLTPSFARSTLLGDESEQFAQAGDDVANALSGLTTGVQTISKIKFNRERKPNLSQNYQTQVERTKDLAHTFAKAALELDIEDYLIKNNNNLEPVNMSTAVRDVYKKFENQIPDKPENAEEGQTFIDPITKVEWLVSGPIMRFNGIRG